MSEARTGAGSKVVSDKWVDPFFKLMHERDAARAEVARLRAAIDALLAEHVLADGEEWCRDCGPGPEDLGHWPCSIIHTIREHLPLIPAEGSHTVWMTDDPSAFALAPQEEA